MIGSVVVIGSADGIGFAVVKLAVAVIDVIGSADVRLAVVVGDVIGSGVVIGSAVVGHSETFFLGCQCQCSLFERCQLLS